MTQYHIAQINIAKARDTMDSDTMKAFVDGLNEVNALADRAPGFIWRLQTEEGDAISIQAFEDPHLIVNMSVWETIDSLKHFVYQSAHAEWVRNRKTWFNKMHQTYQALWWIPAGHIPSIAEGKERLECLESNGHTAHAFTFAKSFNVPPSVSRTLV